MVANGGRVATTYDRNVRAKLAWRVRTGGFEAIYETVGRRIAVACKTHFVPGMEREDVRQEMFITLWHAYQSFDPTLCNETDFESWWWQHWMSRKADLIDRYFALKRPREALSDPDQIQQLVDSMYHKLEAGEAPQCPDPDPITTGIWEMLAQGYQGQEVRKVMHLNNRRFYQHIEALQTDEVWELLTA